MLLLNKKKKQHTGHALLVRSSLIMVPVLLLSSAKSGREVSDPLQMTKSVCFHNVTSKNELIVCVCVSVG